MRTTRCRSKNCSKLTRERRRKINEISTNKAILHCNYDCFLSRERCLPKRRDCRMACVMRVYQLDKHIWTQHMIRLFVSFQVRTSEMMDRLVRENWISKCIVWEWNGRVNWTRNWIDIIHEAKVKEKVDVICVRCNWKEKKRCAWRLDNALADRLATFNIIYESEEWVRRRITLVVENESADELNPFDITYESEKRVRRTTLVVDNE